MSDPFRGYRSAYPYESKSDGDAIDGELDCWILGRLFDSKRAFSNELRRNLERQLARRRTAKARQERNQDETVVHLSKELSSDRYYREREREKVEREGKRARISFRWYGTDE